MQNKQDKDKLDVWCEEHPNIVAVGLISFLLVLCFLKLRGCNHG